MSSYTLDVSEVGQVLISTLWCPNVAGILKLYLAGRHQSKSGLLRPDFPR